METPVFEEFDPASDCDCPGCVHWRRVSPRSLPVGLGGHPAARRTVVVATATAAALGAVPALPALASPQDPDRPGVPAGDEPATPQGRRAPLHGQGSRPTTPAGPVTTPGTTRAEIILRAEAWITAKVPYSMTSYWKDGYRQDCSGYVSMAWKLPANEWTGSLHLFATRITKEELQPGDILLFHNPADPQNGSHVVLFGGWTDHTRTYYVAYEQTRPATRRLATPYAYWSNSPRYVPYRYNGLTTGTAEGKEGTGGTDGAEGSGGSGGVDGPGGVNGGDGARPDAGGGTTGGGPGAVTGTGTDAAVGDPGTGTAVGDAGAGAGAGADTGTGTGTGTGTAAGAGAAPGTAGTAGAGAAAGAPAVPYPGRGYFGPGAHNQYVTQLGRLLVQRGGGRFYTSGPGPRWSEADRQATRAFQLAQGWRGADADGIPGPRTWALLTTGGGKGIAAAAPGPAGSPAPVPPAPASPARVPPYPGRAMFRSGADNPYVTQLGRQLVKKGFGKYYTTGPGPRWGEADRRGVEAFQRAQGWRGGAADGYPGPETWRRLFS